MKKIITILVLVHFLIFSYAQNSTADSLKKLLINTSVDSVRVFLAYKISDAYLFSEPVKAMHFARQALKLAQNINYKKGEARSLTRIGNILAQTDDFTKALETHFEALKINESEKDLIGMAASNNNIARIYTEQETFEGYRLALSYYMKTKETYEKLNDSLNLCIVLLNIGDNYERMNLLDSASFFQQKAYQLARLTQDEKYIGTILMNLGNIHLKKAMIDSAFSEYESAESYLLAANDKQSLSEALFGIAKTFERIKHIDSAIFYAKKSIQIGITINNQVAILNAANYLADLYDSLKNTDSAYAYTKIGQETEKKIFNQDKRAQIQNMSFKEQVRQQDIEEEKAKEETDRKNNLQMVAIAVFIVTFFVILSILSRRKINPRTVELLGILGLLLLFEFILIFIHPYIGEWTHHTPVYMLAIFVAIAAILGPLHHRLTKWIKEKLVRRHKMTEPKVEVVPVSVSANQMTVIPVGTNPQPVQGESTKELPNDLSLSKFIDDVKTDNVTEVIPVVLLKKPKTNDNGPE
jgi:tetratricopeptide (TPR) repeat protein